MQFKIEANTLLKVLIKLALYEDKENQLRALVEYQEALVEGPSRPCHCPSCTMPNLSTELNNEIDVQLVDMGSDNLDDFCDEDLVRKLETDLRAYAAEQQEDAELLQMSNVQKSDTIN